MNNLFKNKNKNILEMILQKLKVVQLKQIKYLSFAYPKTVFVI